MHQYLGETAVTVDDMKQVVLGRRTEYGGNIAGGVFIEYQHFFALPRHRRSDVGNGRRLANTFAPRSKGDDPQGFRAEQAPQARGLVAAIFSHGARPWLRRRR